MIDKIVCDLRTKLPIQNPLHSFVHNNILQMFEHKDFHEAVDEAGKLYRANPYWEIYKYQQKYEEKKILDEDIFRAIDHYLKKYPAIPSLSVLKISSNEFFYRLMFLEERLVIKSENLWLLCREKMKDQKLLLTRRKTHLRGRDYWEKYHNESFALSVHPVIIQLVSSFLDQGQSYWQNPFQNKSFWEFFVYDILSTGKFASGWKKILVSKVNQYQNLSPAEIIEKELRSKGIPEQQWEEYLLEILFDLKGWAGMVNKLESEPWLATVKAPEIKLMDYIAVVLLMESSVDTYHCEQNSLELSFIHGREEKLELDEMELALALTEIIRTYKLEEDWLQSVSSSQLLKIIDEIDLAYHKDRARLWHEAYEHHFHREAIEAIANHELHIEDTDKYVQVLFCIDDREESIRRHLEEQDHGIETFGVVGFFGIDMKFSSLNNNRLIPLCPPVIKASRIIKEVPLSDAVTYKRWNFFRGTSDLGLYYHTRTLFRGFLSTIILGILSVFPMTVQVFFPQHSKTLRNKIYGLIGKEPETDLKIEFTEEGYGYTKSEMARIVVSIIQMCGIKKFTDLVILMGHGSSSNNNPFKQAYGCGACGGNAGLPNSRAFAKMANDPEVRLEVRNLGMEIPDSTYFVSGFHDTCTDEIFFFNESTIPQNLLERFRKFKKHINEAAKLNAYERCHKFSSFNIEKGPEAALKHVRERAHDIAQPRPEYGHSSNALAIVGKRDLTKGLYMNRRAFLLSYDWKIDPDGSILKQVVLGGVPVSVNINLDYYFSAVDNENFGCGSKLPLNLTSLLGVMTGSHSDLRIGLARQMIEIHEPIRNLTVIEAPVERVKGVFEGHPRLKNLLYHHWFRLAVLDPETHKWWMFSQDSFEEIHFEKHDFKHFVTSKELLLKHAEDDFAEIDT